MDHEISHEGKALPYQSKNHVDTMYRDYFLDYASYVILDRAVPYYQDGLKPVQRRILHTLWEKNDGRYHKVANLIGHTMQYHPHGDASIGDALVNVGQKGLLVDTQGNWGNPVTGDGAAAPRYIEGRLTPFALEVLFNPDTTNWFNSYDGRNREPEFLPAKFPLLLASGVEGIAVGLSTKILPHNFCELLEGSIAYLRGRSFKLYPDFLTGGIADVSNYNDGIRGGKVKVRAVIEAVDKKLLNVVEIPYGTTTSSLIDSIVAANDKGKIKIKKVEDNTSKNVEIAIHLAPNTDPNQMIQALYAFTDCEVSISPNFCVVVDQKPEFIGATALLKKSADHTLSLLKWELENKLNDLERRWHMTSLEKIFIENRIYRKIEAANDREHMIEIVDNGLKPHISHLRKEVTRDEILKLTEIPIRRISRFDVEKTDNLLKTIDEELKVVRHDLENITEYTINYFKHLLKKYGPEWPRKTKLEEFETVNAQRVAVANKKLYVDRKNGFVGTTLRKEEFLFECSPYDELAIFKKDCTMMVVKVEDKTFVGKGIEHVEVFDRKDKRRVINYVYQDGKDGKAMGKRFNIGGITRNKDYDLGTGAKGSKLLYFSSNPNGEAETIEVFLKPRPRVKLNYKYDFSDIEVKGRGVKGITVSKYPIKRIKMISEGSSTLGSQHFFYDAKSSMVHSDPIGQDLGEFDANDAVLIVRDSGKATKFELQAAFTVGLNVHYAGRLAEDEYALLYYCGEKLAYYTKKFVFGDLSAGKEVTLISDHKDSKLLYFGPATSKLMLEYQSNKGRGYQREALDLSKEDSQKTIRAIGNRFSRARQIKKVALVTPELESGEVTLEQALKKVEQVKYD